jgi:hypothetical protein
MRIPTMKRMMSTLAALATLMWTCPAVQAEYVGELRRDTDWQFNVDNSSSAGNTAVMVHYLVGRSGEKEIRRDDIEIGLVAAGARTQLIFSKPGRDVRRIIIEVHPPMNATIDVEVSQGPPFASSFPARIEMRPGSLVFDIVD